MPTQEDLRIETLGPRERPSPLTGAGRRIFVPDTARVLCETEIEAGEDLLAPLCYEKAGAREEIYFDPAQTTAAMVTCGGLSPGLNNVIRSAFYELHHNYGVRRVLGIRNGYRGLNPAAGDPPIELTTSLVHRIHDEGGTVLGSSRGPQEPRVVVDFLEREGIDILFCIGGDGTQRGAHAIGEEVGRRGLRKAIVGIPKTIDNDIAHVFPSFGYATALEAAAEALRGAHVEAINAPNGVAIVKLMGRDAGFIAAGAALVSQDANFVLVPEVDFPMEGEDGFLAALERRVVARGHAVVITAEGAGQHLFRDLPEERDASGNKRYRDIGPYLRDRVAAHFAERGVEITLRYIDPSYLIRSVPANAWDRILCDRMGRCAVHAAMAGKTDMLIAYRMGALFHVPIPVVVGERVRMDLTSGLWPSVVAATGQPRWAPLPAEAPAASGETLLESIRATW